MFFSKGAVASIGHQVNLTNIAAWAFPPRKIKCKQRTFLAAIVPDLPFCGDVF